MIDKLLITCLQRNKRLVLPTLGAFIRKSIDGVGVVLVFVPFLNKDDGVLLNAFKGWAGVEESEAKLMLEEYIDHIKNSLKNRGQYIIEGIGVLKYDANGSIYLGKESEAKKSNQPESKPEEIVAPKQETITEVKPVISTPEHVTPKSVVREQPTISEPKEASIQPQLEQSLLTPTEPISQPINEPAQDQEYGSGLNSQFAKQPVQPDLHSVQQPPLQPTQQPEVQVGYRTVTTSAKPIIQPQRRPGNMGAVYFTGDESQPEQQSSSEEEEKVIVQTPEIPRYIQQQQQPPRTQQLTQQQRNSALYGSASNSAERRVANPNIAPQRPAQQPQPQLVKPQMGGQRPIQQGAHSSAQRSPQRKSNATFATKLVWTLAIVAIILTVCVMIYAVLYGSEMPIDEVQIDTPNTEITIDE